MADAKLVFFRPPDGTGHLVFGDTGEAAAAPEATIGIDADLPGLDGVVLLRTGPVLGLDAELPGLGGTVELLWDANVSRGMREELQTGWQQGAPVAVGVNAAWQASAPMCVAAIALWQHANPVRSALQSCWQATTPMRSAATTHWQSGAPMRASVAQHWQEAVRHRAGIAAHWQEGARRREAIATHWQELLRLRAGVDTHWQDAARLRTAAIGRWGDGLRIRKPLRAHWQEAMRPPAGVSVRPVPPKPPPCYDPATLGRLIFTDPHSGDGRLVFVCTRGGTEPATIIVLPRRSYIVINAISLVRVSDGATIPAYNFSMSLDTDSWTWSWSATLPATALPLIQPAPGGEPVDVLATVNGTPYHLCVEQYGRQREFANTRISVRGRGRAAILDVPYAPTLSHGNTLARTAHQLMGEVLTLNGVSFGWGVDFGLEDWLVPGNVWTHQGSYISAILEIAAAAGGYVQPHNTAETLRVLSRYPVAPWDWGGVTPDYELPSAVMTSEGTEWSEKARYNRVYVMGQQAGVNGRVTRAGTAGDYMAPTIVDPLITQDAAARQRGLAVLSDTGRIASVSLRMPVLAETGIIPPGKFVRYQDNGGEIIGITRSVSVDAGLPEIWQVIGVETHVEPV